MKKWTLHFILLLSSTLAYAQLDTCEIVVPDLSIFEKTFVNYSSQDSGTPLIRAASSGDLALVIALVKAGADINKSSPGDGTPLIMAAKNGHLAVVRYLVERGAEVDQYVSGDETPLIRAAGNGHLATVKYLVEQGADINKTVRDSYTLLSERQNALLMAQRGKHPKVVQFLIKAGTQ